MANETSMEDINRAMNEWSRREGQEGAQKLVDLLSEKGQGMIDSGYLTGALIGAVLQIPKGFKKSIDQLLYSDIDKRLAVDPEGTVADAMNLAELALGGGIGSSLLDKEAAKALLGINKASALREFGREGVKLIKKQRVFREVSGEMLEPSVAGNWKEQLKSVLRSIHKTPQSELDPIRDITPGLGPKEFRGSFSSKTNKIKLNLGASTERGLGSTLIHELVHGRTYNPKDITEKFLVDRIIKASEASKTKLKNLKASYDAGEITAGEFAKRQGKYYADDPAELLAKAVERDLEEGMGFAQSYLRRLEEIANEL